MVKQGIVVCTWSGGSSWANLCLYSLRELYGMVPIYVVVNDAQNADEEWIQQLAESYNTMLLFGDFREVGALKAITDHTNLDEFWFFQDSIQITDPSFIVNSFVNYSGKDVTYHHNHFQYYLGMWDANILRTMEFPEMPKTKEEAIALEADFCNAYSIIKNKDNLDASQCYIVDLDFDHLNLERNYVTHLFGEQRVAVVGNYLIKRLSVVPENLLWPDRTPFSAEYFLEWIKQWKVAPEDEYKLLPP